ncbi:hypothetical protein AJ78_04055 [Emergomyces pasteurianus Ep9510]|uniref:Uncharacterized protein n=1 Tax=Emergomyces pasteurianus Ep9510 TaxID=1447872 RepID=A0A1J9PH22_9EURO|nr:hypothetical protein AJ78_04055 [Emergomyces pasteurianus Ep9510]
MSNALNLIGLETLSASEKARRITAVANDITISIIYIAKHTVAGNLTAEQVAPIYDLIDKVNVVGKQHNRRLESELEAQDLQIEAMKRMLVERERRIEEMRRESSGGDVQSDGRGGGGWSGR